MNHEEADQDVADEVSEEEYVLGGTVSEHKRLYKCKKRHDTF